MKQVFSFFVAAFLFISASSFTTNVLHKSDRDNDQRIEVVFTRNLKYNDLVQIKRDLAANGISIEYLKLEFDKKRNLKKIEFIVECNDGFTGKASTSNLSSGKKFGFYRDFDEDSNNRFFAGFFR